MPVTRNPNNENLITSLAAYAYSYIYQIYSFNRMNLYFKIEMQFSIANQYNLEQIVKIFYDSEINPGLWNKYYKINECQLSGTLKGNFFFQPFTSIENITSILLNLYVALYYPPGEEKTEATDNMIAKIYEMASIIGGSTHNPFQITKSIKDQNIYNTDYIQCVFNLSRESNLIRFTTDELNQAIIRDKQLAQISPFISPESLARIIKMRLNVDAHTALNNEYIVDRDELHEAMNDYAMTSYEHAHLWPDASNSSHESNRITARYNFRPRLNPINYRQYLNSSNSRLFNRRKRRRQLYRGSGLNSYNTYWQIIDNHYNKIYKHQWN